MLTDQQRRVESQRASTNYTPAQRVRQKHTQRRRLKHDRGLSPFRAVLETCIQFDEVLEDMLALNMDPNTEKLFAAVVVRHVDGEYLKFRTILVDPTADGIGRVMREIETLKESKVLGSIFRLYDLKAGVSRNWGRPFLPGEEVRKNLERALREQSREESKTMQWFEEAKQLAPIALKASIAWGNSEGKIVLEPLGHPETFETSIAQSGLLAEKFVPIHCLVLVPDAPDGVRITQMAIPPLGSESRILAAQLMPAAVQAFALEAKREGIAGDDELTN